ncbi:hypothetical protein E2C01_102322 [Portunus trituberculatus]|uniref:Uncharacterized protein n=1 Tax=Portunus trituberculatus TaxID=210409 RepID=A0A5B7KMB0_PORTR|nr:hypothetical protein [Portunus trituberculatus]
MDQEVDHWRTFKQRRTRRERMDQGGAAEHPLHTANTRILDRFQVCVCLFVCMSVSFFVLVCLSVCLYR